jgi:hypothetical protein
VDGAKFAQLSRRVGEAPTRRAAIKVLAAALAAPLLGGLGQEQAAAIPIVNCKAPGKRCDSDHRCCTGNCHKGVCTCAKKGHQCWAPLEGSLCCSQRCANGKCS